MLSWELKERGLSGSPPFIRCTVKMNFPGSHPPTGYHSSFHYLLFNPCFTFSTTSLFCLPCQLSYRLDRVTLRCLFFSRTRCMNQSQIHVYDFLKLVVRKSCSHYIFHILLDFSLRMTSSLPSVFFFSVTTDLCFTYNQSESNLLF